MGRNLSQLSFVTLASGLIALLVGVNTACTDQGSGNKDSALRETADGDYEDRDAEVNFAWTVEDSDPAGLNCHGGRPFGEGLDIAAFKVIAAFPKNSILFGSAGMTKASDGKAWLFVAHDASGCFVRANRRFVRPLDLPIEYPVGFRNIFTPEDPSLPAPTFQWLFTAKEATPCRQQPSTTATVVRSFKKGDSIQDIETEMVFNPQFKFENPERDELSTVMVTEAIEIDGQSWFKLWMAKQGPINEPRNVCFIRASRQILRPIR